jgi:type IV secretion system protein VirB10
MSEQDSKNIDVDDNQNKDADLQDDNTVVLTEKRKKILLYSAIVIVFILLVTYFNNEKNKEVAKLQEKSNNYDDSQLQDRLDKSFANLNKQQIKYLNADNQNVIKPPQQASTPKYDPKLDNLMKAPLRPNLNDSNRKIAVSTQKLSTASMKSKEGYGSFANSQPTDVTTITANKLKETDYLIVQGELLHGVLNTAISSEIQGDVTATLTKPAYSYTGKNILIPIGSRLVGSYAMANMGNGMAATRIFIIWNRVITPNGISIMINSPSKDNLGMTGTSADVVDRHFFLMFGASTLLSVIGVGAANITGSGGANGQSAQQSYLTAMQSSFSNTANNMLSKFTSISPTLYANQGKEINIFINKDLNLYGAYH